jgi:hypothetical protein
MCAFGIIIGKCRVSSVLYPYLTFSLGDTIPHVIRSIFPTLHTIPVLSLLTNRQFIIALCTTCVSYPLSLYRDIHKLSRASGLALLSMLVIVSAVLIEGSHVSPDLKGDPSKRLTVMGPGVFQAIGVISFAFVCHHNSLLIYGSLRTPTLDRFAQVTHISTIISLVACCTLAISGFWVFTNRTQGNILNNFSGVSFSLILGCLTSDTCGAERCADQCCPFLLWTEYVYDVALGAICLQRSKLMVCKSRTKFDSIVSGNRTILLLARKLQSSATRLFHHHHPLLIDAS